MAEPPPIEVPIPSVPPITLWFDPDDAASERAKTLLEACQVELTLFPYKTVPPGELPLEDVAARFGGSPRAFVRRRDPLYNQLKVPDMSDESLYLNMRAHRSLIDGPIALCGDEALLGRPPELLVKLLIPKLPAGVKQDDFMRILIRGQLGQRFTPPR